MLLRYLTAGCSGSPPKTSLASFCLRRLQQRTANGEKWNRLVRFIDISHGYDSKIPIISKVSKSGTRAWLQASALDNVFCGIETDWHAEKAAICEPYIFHDSDGTLADSMIWLLKSLRVVILFIHKPCTTAMLIPHTKIFLLLDHAACPLCLSGEQPR